MTTVPKADAQVQFLLNIQRLLEEGSFVSTYKHALLLSIADICVEKGDDSGGKLHITTKDLTEKFISYYWRQSICYEPMGQDSRVGTVLRQSHGKQVSVIKAIAEAHERYGNSLTQFKSNSRAWNQLRLKVAKTITIMPLWKLQTVGRQRLDFLYCDVPGDDSVIELKEGICFCFRRFMASFMSWLGERG